tara:strand:+ start:475 stop:714 length:240 start_codon:yes stop_codon:yes gene_type:complete
MNSNPQQNLENQSIEGEKTDLKAEDLSPSATTTDVPEFGWSSYAERTNGRFAMIGLFAVILIEAFSKISFLEWAGIINK